MKIKLSKMMIEKIQMIKNNQMIRFKIQFKKKINENIK